jgi:hypothetical protein
MSENAGVDDVHQCPKMQVFNKSDMQMVSTTVQNVHRKKKDREIPVNSWDVTNKLSLGGNNDVITELFLPRGGVWLVTSRLETGNS